MTPACRASRLAGAVGDRDAARARRRAGRRSPLLRRAGPRRRSAARRTPTSRRSSRSTPDLVVVNDEENRAEDARVLADCRVRAALDVAALGRATSDRRCGTLAAAARRRRAGAVRWRRVGRLARVDADAALVGRVRRGVAPAVDVARDRHLRRVAARPARRRQRVRRLARSLSRGDAGRGRGARAERRAAPGRAVRVRDSGTSREVQAEVPGVPVRSSTAATCSGGASARPLAATRLRAVLAQSLTPGAPSVAELGADAFGGVVDRARRAASGRRARTTARSGG